MARDMIKTKQRFNAPIPGTLKPSTDHKFKRQSKGSGVATESKKLIIQPRPDWHAAAALQDVAISTGPHSINAVLIDKVHDYAKTLLEEENKTYVENNSRTSSSYGFMSTIMSSGTWSDKVSALTLVVQESPLHTMKPFETLINLAGKHSRSQALLALGAVKDLFSQGVVLPSDRKLRMFGKQPGLLVALQGVRPAWNSKDGLPKGLGEAQLMLWAYEDWLKQQYFEILKLLERWCNDEVEFAQTRAVTFVWELLKEKPEQEENLLRLLVNKLGDTSRKVASRASYLLLQLQHSHPSMKTIIINAVESDILLRTGQSLLAKYYAIITLNQTVLQTTEVEVANKLLEVYFGLFVILLNRQRKPPPKEDIKVDRNSKKRKRTGGSAKDGTEEATVAEQELADKIVAQVLAGINRAFPFSSKDSGAVDKHLDAMYRIAHSANFNTSIQALMLIQQISTSQHLSTDRFLRTLYESLLDPRLLRSSKQTMYLNLLYRSLKEDVSVRRTKAFVKRLLQILTLHEPAFASAVLYLVLELQVTYPSIKAMLAQPETLEDDDEEAFADVPEEVEDHGASAAVMDAQRALANGLVNGSVHSHMYDGRKRDPEHSNADRTCLWELLPWTHHFHPSVTIFADYLTALSLTSSNTTLKPPAKPDPATHTLIHFLDRFAYRNPKKSQLPSTANAAAPALRGTSIMQPALASSNTTDHFLTPGIATHGASAARGSLHPWESLTAESFWKKQAEQVRPDEVFFHKYFSVTGPRKEAKSKKRGRKDVDADSDVDEIVGKEFGEDEDVVGDEDEIWKALVGSAPELEDAGDEDEEDGFDSEDLDGYGDDDDDDSGVDGGVDVEGGLDLDDIDEGIMGAEAEADENDTDDDDNGGVDVEDELEGDLGLDEEGSDIFGTDDEEAGEEPVQKVKDVKKSKTRKDKTDEKSGKNKRRRLRDLPTFAPAEEYAEALLDGGNEDEDM